MTPTSSATNETARRVEDTVKAQAARFAQEHPSHDGHSVPVLRYVTTFVGGGGPRFWFSASPQLQQLNYAQVLIEVTDKEITPQFIRELQPVALRIDSGRAHGCTAVADQSDRLSD